MEKDLAVGALDLLLHIHLGAGSFIATYGEVVHPSVLGNGLGGQQRQGHGNGGKRG